MTHFLKKWFSVQILLVTSHRGVQRYCYAVDVRNGLRLPVTINKGGCNIYVARDKINLFSPMKDPKVFPHPSFKS